VAAGAPSSSLPDEFASLVVLLLLLLLLPWLLLLLLMVLRLLVVNNASSSARAVASSSSSDESVEPESILMWLSQRQVRCLPRSSQQLLQLCRHQVPHPRSSFTVLPLTCGVQTLLCFSSTGGPHANYSPEITSINSDLSNN
jgi:hypothetical protein